MRRRVEIYDCDGTRYDDRLAHVFVPIELGWDAVLVTRGKDRDLGGIPAGIRTISTIGELE